MSDRAATCTLAPDAHAPGLARAFLARELADQPPELSEVGQLLISELVTNAVVHAASAVEVEVTVQEAEVVVRVRDADTGPLVARAGGGSELDEGGRGFVLIDRLAQAWGTEHHGGRKTVWFRLTSGEPGQPVRPRPPSETADDTGAAPRAARMLRTLVLRPALKVALTYEEHVGELLARMISAVGAGGAVVTIATATETSIARGDPAGDVTESRELVSDGHRLGILTVFLSAAPDDDADAFLGLAADRIALLTVQYGVLEAEQARAGDHEFLSEATELLAGSLNVSLSLALLTQITVPRLADWCAAFEVDDRARPRRVTASHRQEERIDAVNETLSVDRELQQAIHAAAHGKPVQRLPTTVAVAGQRSHVVVLPLVSRARILGVLVLGRAEPLDAVRFMAGVELSRRAAIAVDNARLHEEHVATATALQKSLLPTALPRIDGVDLAARYHSASPGMLVGGDFYDAVVLADGSTVFAIGDVCGKGAEAASVTGMSRDLLRMLVQDGTEPAAALRRLNRALVDHPSSSRFCTVALTKLTWADDELRARICLAGHPEPVVLRADGSTELVGVPGDLLGVLPDGELDLVEADVLLAEGDALVLYTDGVTERRHGARMFGQYGVRSTLERSSGASAEVLAHNLELAAKSFVDSELRDDLAILVIRRER